MVGPPDPGPPAAGGHSGTASRGPRGGRPPWKLSVFLTLSTVLAAAADAATLVRRARRGPWRVEVAESSMAPALLPGDWLLVDPTCRRWPARGSIVVAREPETDTLVLKRVAARTGATVRAPWGEPITLAAGEAWLLGDADHVSVDSRRFGPVGRDRLVAVVRWRYGPARRFGRLGPRVAVRRGT